MKNKTVGGLSLNRALIVAFVSANLLITNIFASIANASTCTLSLDGIISNGNTGLSSSTATYEAGDENKRVADNSYLDYELATYGKTKYPNDDPQPSNKNLTIFYNNALYYFKYFRNSGGTLTWITAAAQIGWITGSTFNDIFVQDVLKLRRKDIYKDYNSQTSDYYPKFEQWVNNTNAPANCSGNYITVGKTKDNSTLCPYCCTLQENGDRVGSHDIYNCNLISAQVLELSTIKDDVAYDAIDLSNLANENLEVSRSLKEIVIPDGVSISVKCSTLNTDMWALSKKVDEEIALIKNNKTMSGKEFKNKSEAIKKDLEIIKKNTGTANKNPPDVNTIYGCTELAAQTAKKKEDQNNESKTLADAIKSSKTEITELEKSVASNTEKKAAFDKLKKSSDYSKCINAKVDDTLKISDPTRKSTALSGYKTNCDNFLSQIKSEISRIDDDEADPEIMAAKKVAKEKADAEAKKGFENITSLKEKTTINGNQYNGVQIASSNVTKFNDVIASIKKKHPDCKLDITDTEYNKKTPEEKTTFTKACDALAADLKPILDGATGTGGLLASDNRDNIAAAKNAPATATTPTAAATAAAAGPKPSPAQAKDPKFIAAQSSAQGYCKNRCDVWYKSEVKKQDAKFDAIGVALIDTNNIIKFSCACGASGEQSYLDQVDTKSRQDKKFADEQGSVSKFFGRDPEKSTINPIKNPICFTYEEPKDKFDSARKDLPYKEGAYNEVGLKQCPESILAGVYNKKHSKTKFSDSSEKLKQLEQLKKDREKSAVKLAEAQRKSKELEVHADKLSKNLEGLEARDILKLSPDSYKNVFKYSKDQLTAIAAAKFELNAGKKEIDKLRSNLDKEEAELDRLMATPEIQQDSIVLDNLKKQKESLAEEKIKLNDFEKNYDANIKTLSEREDTLRRQSDEKIGAAIAACSDEEITKLNTEIDALKKLPASARTTQQDGTIAENGRKINRINECKKDVETAKSDIEKSRFSSDDSSSLASIYNEAGVTGGPSSDSLAGDKIAAGGSEKNPDGTPKVADGKPGDKTIAGGGDGTSTGDGSDSEIAPVRITKDRCSDGRMIIIAKKAVEKFKEEHPDEKITPSVIKDYLTGEGGKITEIQAEINNGDAEHSCNPDFETIDFYSTIQKGISIATTAYGQFEAIQASGKTQAAAAEGKDAFSHGAKNLGNAQIASGSVQATSGTAQLVLGGIAYKIAHDHKQAKREIEEASGTTDGVSVTTDVDEGKKTVRLRNGTTKTVEKSGKLTVEGLAAAIRNEDDMNAKDANQEGALMNEKALSGHKEVETEGKNLAVSLFSEGIKSLAEGAANIYQGIQNKKIGDEIEEQNKQPDTPVLQPFGGTSPDNPPASVNNAPTQAVDTSESPIAEEKPPEDANDAPVIPPFAGGRGGGGGLADAPVPVSGGVNTPAPTTSIAGGGGGGGGGSNGEGGGGEQTPGGDSINTPGAKFESSTAGGGLFGSGSSNSGKRVSETGMDLNGLLAQFLPKKDDDKKGPGGNILDFGKNKGGSKGRTPADADDNSILGPKSNLFLRISGATHAYYKRGDLK